MWVFCTLISSFFLSFPAYSATFSYDNTTSAAIGNTTSCTVQDGGSNGGTVIANITRTFNVTTHFSINDLDLGFRADHTWRGDIQITLISPQGTTQIITIPDTSTTGNENNFDLAFDDEAAGVYDNNANDVTAAPNYAADRSGTPSNPLSVFDGENAFGTWTILMCDQYPTSDNGTYLSSQLLFDGNPIADLAITKTSDGGGNYTPGVVLTYTLTVTNNGPENASGITIADTLPNGLTLHAPVTCTSTGTASCGAATFGIAGDSGFSDTAASVDAGAGNSVIYTVPVFPSTDMTDY